MTRISDLSPRLINIVYLWLRTVGSVRDIRADSYVRCLWGFIAAAIEDHGAVRTSAFRNNSASSTRAFDKNRNYSSFR